MKKFFLILFFNLFVFNFSYSEIVKDPELIKKLDKIREENEKKSMENHKKRFDSRNNVLKKFNWPPNP